MRLNGQIKCYRSMDLTYIYPILVESINGHRFSHNKLLLNQWQSYLCQYLYNLSSYKDNIKFKKDSSKYNANHFYFKFNQKY